jgi:hypothetical protein
MLSATTGLGHFCAFLKSATQNQINSVGLKNYELAQNLPSDQNITKLTDFSRESIKITQLYASTLKIRLDS